jgi:DNA adenine methylase
MNGSTPHIVQYQGSKRILASQILRYFPRRFERLVEPFAGMAAITIAAAEQHRANHYLVNDINAPIIQILHDAIEFPQVLIEEYSKVWLEQFHYEGGHIAHFYKVRDDFNSGNKSAANMLYLIARCVKGSVRYSCDGLFNQSPDKRRNGTSPKNLATNINRISNYLKGITEFSAKDYRDVLNETHSGDIIYMDPPYQGVSNVRDSRYLTGIEYNSFVESLEILNNREMDYIVSYDGSCGDKHYGQDLPEKLGLTKVMLNAGYSSQSILLGNKKVTYEALYISPGLKDYIPKPYVEASLFEAAAI